MFSSSGRNRGDDRQYATRDDVRRRVGARPAALHREHSGLRPISGPVCVEQAHPGRRRGGDQLFRAGHRGGSRLRARLCGARGFLRARRRLPLDSVDEAYRRAKEYAHKALQLDETVPSAHASLAGASSSTTGIGTEPIENFAARSSSIRGTPAHINGTPSCWLPAESMTRPCSKGTRHSSSIPHRYRRGGASAGSRFMPGGRSSARSPGSGYRV